MTLFVLHLLAILHGLAASLAWLTVFHLAGLAFATRRWSAPLGGVARPLLTGAAAYVLTCWFGIQNGIRLAPLAVAFVGVTLAVALLRWRSAVESLRSAVVSREFRASIGLFAGLYVLAYLFVLPPVSPANLPLSWLGNVDLFQYLVYARHVLQLGGSPIADVSTHSYVYFQTPGAFYLLDAVSLFYSQDPMLAAMPALLASAALTGVTAAAVARRFFGLPFPAAAGVAATVVSGPFFRFIQGHYYLSTLLAMPVLLHLCVQTVDAARAAREERRGLPLAFFGHQVLLLLVYPYLLVVGLMFQASAVAMVAFASWRDGERPGAVTRTAAAIVGSMALASAALALLMPTHLAWVWAMLRLLSHTGLWGWPMDVISPFALLGVPAVVGKAQAGSPAAHAAYLAALWLGGSAALMVFMLRGPWRRVPVEGRVVVGLAGVGFLAYAAYFSLVGPSYQQWKLASYTALPWSFAFVALGLAVLMPAGASRVGGRQPIRAAVLPLLCATLVGGNAIVHGAADPAFFRLPGGLRNIAELDSLPFKHLSIEVGEVRDALLVSYFLPTKRLHVSMPQFIPDEPVVLDRISPAQPLFALNFGCEGVGHQDVRPVLGAGCLLLQPPSLSAGVSYPFNRTFMFIQGGGLASREEWGRWNGRRAVELKLLADARRVRLDGDAAWLNLFLQPALVAGVTAQRIRLAWGGDRRAEVVLGERGWISLPLRGGWAGDWVASQVISFEFPDILPPHAVDGERLETRRLAVGFLELSVGANPRGRTVLPFK